MEKSNRSYVYGKYHIRRKGQKERKERKKKNMETSIYENRKEKKRNIRSSIYPNTSFPTTDERIICSSKKTTKMNNQTKEKTKRETKQK
jgi:hypothetical protein